MKIGAGLVYHDQKTSCKLHTYNIAMSGTYLAKRTYETIYIHTYIYIRTRYC